MADDPREMFAEAQRGLITLAVGLVDEVEQKLSVGPEEQTEEQLERAALAATRVFVRANVDEIGRHLALLGASSRDMTPDEGGELVIGVADELEGA